MYQKKKKKKQSRRNEITVVEVRKDIRKKEKQVLPEMKSKLQCSRKSTFKEKYNKRHYKKSRKTAKRVKVR